MIAVVMYYIFLSVIFGSAVLLMWHDKTGWGWLIFCGFIIATGTTISTGDKECSNKPH